MMRQTFKGTISIVSHGHGQLVRSLLQDLLAQQGIDDWRVILTLNIPEASGANALGEADLAGLNGSITRNAVPKGFGANHNAAAGIAEGELFLIVNPDIRLTQPDTLARLAAMSWQVPAPALRAPVVVGPDGTYEDSVRSNLSLPNLIQRARHRAEGWEADPAASGFFSLIHQVDGSISLFHSRCEAAWSRPLPAYRAPTARMSAPIPAFEALVG